MIYLALRVEHSHVKLAAFAHVRKHRQPFFDTAGGRRAWKHRFDESRSWPRARPFHFKDEPAALRDPSVKLIIALIKNLAGLQPLLDGSFWHFDS